MYDQGITAEFFNHGIVDTIIMDFVVYLCNHMAERKHVNDGKKPECIGLPASSSYFFNVSNKFVPFLPLI